MMPVAFLRPALSVLQEVTFRAVCCDFRLKPIDIKFMRALHQKVNIVPVIAKADMLTPVELKKLKKKVNIGLQ